MLPRYGKRISLERMVKLAKSGRVTRETGKFTEDWDGVVCFEQSYYLGNGKVILAPCIHLAYDKFVDVVRKVHPHLAEGEKVYPNKDQEYHFEYDGVIIFALARKGQWEALLRSMKEEESERNSKKWRNKP